MPQELAGLKGLGPKTERAKTEDRLKRDPAKSVGRHIQSLYSNDVRFRLPFDAVGTALTTRGGASKTLGRVMQEAPMYYDPVLSIGRTMTPDVDPQTRTNVFGSNMTLVAGNAIKDALMTLALKKLAGSSLLGKVASERVEGIVNAATDPFLASGVNKINDYMLEPDAKGKTRFDKIPYLTEMLSGAAKSRIGDSYLFKDGLKSLGDPSETGDYYLGDDEVLFQLMKLADRKNVPSTKIDNSGKLRIDRSKPMTPLQKRNAAKMEEADINKQKFLDVLRSPQGRATIEFLTDLQTLDKAIPKWATNINKALPPLPSAGKPYTGPNKPTALGFAAPSVNAMRNAQ